ncbi:hypothetical protein SAMD00023353_0802070 [Rosellinia necatrix]|uniref:Uncharacterized protein n=1 Tax=Rosellinia necatrix TaxID=77044 RepID=A0A1W2TB67_ROSNE|nr:hypothetical protein SAMD00023353_0802070 [Rosellinia necatrix]
MASSEQNPGTVGGQADEISSISRDPAAQQVSEPGQANNANDAEPAPPLPQRPTPSHLQTLPQPFYNQHQQPYVPYPGQLNPQFTYATPVRPLPKQSSAYIGTRLGLTALSSVWGIIIIALTSILLSQGGSVANVSLYAYAIVVASILWNTAELITYCVRLRKEVQRGIHPGAHVGLHLIFWLAGAFAILLTVTVYSQASYSLQSCEEGGYDSDYRYYGYSYCSEYQPYDYFRWNVLPVLRATLAIFALWLINHFVLFVLACIDTHKRNVLKPAAFVVPVPALNAPPPPQGVYYPPQAAGAQPIQPMQYYPYPVAVQPQPQPQPAGAAVVSNEKQVAPAGQNIAGFYAPPAPPPPPPVSQDIAGFYGPSAGPSTQAP